LPPENFAAMTRLDHNRAVSLLATRTGHNPTDVDGVIIWGNHSTTQYPDIHHASVGGRSVLDWVGIDWYKQSFIGTVQNRGAEVIRVRGKSSAGSGANAALEHMRDWVLGTPGDRWVSMAVRSDGSYGVEPGLVFSFPVTIRGGHWLIVPDIPLDDFSRARIQASEAELKLERDMVRHLMP
jgi:malate dehydrogenase